MPVCLPGRVNAAIRNNDRVNVSPFLKAGASEFPPLDWSSLKLLAHADNPLIAWRPGHQGRELTVSQPGYTPWGSYGLAMSPPEHTTLSANGDELTLSGAFPRWSRWSPWSELSPLFQLTPDCCGIGVSVMALVLAMRGTQDPLIRFEDREHLATIRQGLGLNPGMPGERASYEIGPVTIQLSGSYRGEPKDRMTLITPAGEAIRQSLAELNSGHSPAAQLRELTPEHWAFNAPRPRWDVTFDHAAGVANLPMRVAEYDDAELRRAGWRGSLFGEWRALPEHTAPLRVWAEPTIDATMAPALTMETTGYAGAPVRATLQWRPGV